MPERILILLLGAIGDVTRALSLLMRVREQWPGAHIAWAVEPRSRGVIEGHPALDEIIVFDRPRGFPAYLRFVQELRSREFELVLDLQRHLKSGVTSFLTRAERRVGFSRKNAKEFNWLFNTDYIPPVENFSPKIFQYQEFGDLLGLPRKETLEFGLAVSAEERENIEQIIESSNPRGLDCGPEVPAVLIVGSTWESRFWRPEYYRELIIELQERWKITSIVIGGRSEREFVEKITAGSTELPLIDLVEKTTLRELMALFSRTRVAVGADSGPMHIAAAIGTPVISLWGSTSPKRSAPYGSEHLVIESSVPCAPCYQRTCPGMGMICMKQITPQTVLKTVEQALV